MAQLEKTKCGLEPDMSEVPFKITTKMVEEHLQKAINLMVRDLREKNVNARDVRITVMTDNISKQFRPFIIAIPMDGAVKGRGGTALQPGINTLESAKDFPKDGPILIITDGEIEDHLNIKHEHAYLLPQGKHLPFRAKGPIFYFEE